MIHSYPWYFQEWLASEARAVLTLEQRGLYREVLDMMYMNGGWIHTDPNVIRRKCGVDPEEFERSWPAVRSFLQETDDGKLTHRKVTSTVEKLEQYHEDKRKAGIQSGRARKQKKRTALEQCSNSVQTELEQAVEHSSNLPQPSTTSSSSTSSSFRNLREGIESLTGEKVRQPVIDKIQVRIENRGGHFQDFLDQLSAASKRFSLAHPMRAGFVIETFSREYVPTPGYEPPAPPRKEPECKWCRDTGKLATDYCNCRVGRYALQVYGPKVAVTA